MPIADFQLPVLASVLLAAATLAQEPPAPPPSTNSTATVAPTASLPTTPSTAGVASPTPASTPAARSVRISFVPPPMEGTVSLGIFDSDKKLVRVLHREAKVDSFTIDESSLTTSWDGKNDAGEDLPPGKYHARGYLVGDLKVTELSPAPTAAPVQSADHVSIRLVVNPLLNDVRSVMDIGVAFDANGSFLRTMENLPLYTVSKTPNLSQTIITKEPDKTVTVWQTDASGARQFRIANLDKMMAFDCGDFQLK